LGGFAAIAINGDSLQANAPTFFIQLFDIVYGCLVGDVDGFGDGSGKEGLNGGHHVQVGRGG